MQIYLQHAIQYKTDWIILTEFTSPTNNFDLSLVDVFEKLVLKANTVFQFYI